MTGARIAGVVLLALAVTGVVVALVVGRARRGAPAGPAQQADLGTLGAAVMKAVEIVVSRAAADEARAAMAESPARRRTLLVASLGVVAAFAFYFVSLLVDGVR